MNMLQTEMELIRLSPAQKRFLQRQSKALNDSGDVIKPRVCALMKLKGETQISAVRAAIVKLIHDQELFSLKLCSEGDAGFRFQYVDEQQAVQIVDIECSLAALQSLESARGLLQKHEASTHDTLFAMMSNAGSVRTLYISFPSYLADLYTLYVLCGQLQRNFEHVMVNSDLQFLDVSETLNDMQQERPSDLSLQKTDLDLLNNNIKLKTYRLPTHVVGKLKAQAEELNTNPEVLGLAWWCLLLARLTQQENLCIGLLHDGRRHDQELQEVIGRLSIYFPYADSVHDKMTLRSWLPLLNAVLARRDQAIESYNGDPAGLVKEAGPGLHAFPYLFEYLELPNEVLEGELPQVEEDDPEPARLSLQLISKQSASTTECEGICNLAYDPERIPAYLASILAEQFEAMLNLVPDPFQSLGSLRVSGCRIIKWQNEYNSKHSCEQLVSNFDSTNIYGRITDIAKIHAQRPAISDGQCTLTYAEFCSLIQRYAIALQNKGVVGGDRIAVSCTRDADFYALMIAIMACGAVFVPIDTCYPVKRLQYILADVRCKLLVVDEQPSFDTFGTLLVRGSLLGDESQIFESDVPATAPAYIIYTSGTTGHPKGVVVSHANVLCYTEGVVTKHNFSIGMRFASLSSYASDLGYTSVFAALLNGGQLQVVSDKLMLDADGLASDFKQRGIDILKIVPSHLYSLLQSLPEPTRKKLLPKHCLILGGEVLPPALRKQIDQLDPDLMVINHYGPTESTIGVLTHESLVTEKLHPLGNPLNNVSIWILGSDGQPVMPGCSGELAIGGTTLAQGYFNKPDLTAERFVPDAWSGELGTRLYLSGDLVRVNQHGKVEFIGRIDDQIKLRGHRIEPMEIASTISGFLAINDVCLLFDRHSSNPQLRAFIVAEEEFDVDSLHRFLASELPEHMLPTVIYRLDHFPLTRNGKVDRPALLAFAKNHDTHQYKPPQTEIEQKLVEIWQEVFNIERVGLLDHFFHLGGHSLLAAQVLARIRTRFKCTLDIRQFFTVPVLQDMAAAIENADEVIGFMVTPQATSANIPLSLGQQRFWIIAQSQAGDLAYNSPYQLDIKGELNIDAIWLAFDDVIERHDVLRTKFIEQGDQPWQVLDSEAKLPRKYYDISVEANQLGCISSKLGELLLGRFNLAEDLLMRVVILRLSDNHHRLLLVVHHIIWDGLSNAVFMQDLLTAYAARTCNNRPDWMPLAIQYSDYALCEHKWVNSDAAREQLNYWQTQLHKLPQLCFPKVDYLRGESTNRGVAGASVPFLIDKDVSDRVKKIAINTKTTPFAIMLSVYFILLSRRTGQQDFAVGTSMANRGQPELESLIGFFINQLVLRAPLSGNPDFRELVGRARKMLLDAYAHQQLPFNKLVSHMNLHRGSTRSPLFQVMFVFQNAPERALLNEYGLEIEALTSDVESSKFDLTLYISENAACFQGAFVFDKNLFKSTDIESMANEYSALLNSVLDEPELPISRLLEQQEQAKKRVESKFSGLRKRKNRAGEERKP